ncbi:MAG: ribose-phosphate diphosphokinase [Patescibacteria group bacterium]|nr:ribose-phosphate diphosphokinase [Patescibacteria group bacterium]
MPEDKLVILSGNAYPEFADQVCTYLGIQRTPVTIKQFSNTQYLVKVDETVRGKDVFIIQTGHSPIKDSANLFEELAMIAFATKDAAAGPKRIAVMPYMHSVRSDKKDEPRIATGVKYKIIALERACGVNGFLSMHLHDTHIRHYTDDASLDELYIPPILAKKLNEDLDIVHYPNDFVLVAPDVGMSKLVRRIAQAIGVDPTQCTAVIDKERIGHNEQTECKTIIGSVKGRTAILIDDEALGGGTLVTDGDELEEAGAKELCTFFTHPILSGNSYEVLQKRFNRIYTTNTVPVDKKRTTDKFVIIDVAPLFAEAIRRIHYGESLSELSDSFIKDY